MTKLQSCVVCLKELVLGNWLCSRHLELYLLSAERVRETAFRQANHPNPTLPLVEFSMRIRSEERVAKEAAQLIRLAATEKGKTVSLLQSLLEAPSA